MARVEAVYDIRDNMSSTLDGIITRAEAASAALNQIDDNVDKLNRSRLTSFRTSVVSELRQVETQANKTARSLERVAAARVAMSKSGGGGGGGGGEAGYFRPGEYMSKPPTTPSVYGGGGRGRFGSPFMRAAVGAAGLFGPVAVQGIAAGLGAGGAAVGAAGVGYGAVAPAYAAALGVGATVRAGFSPLQQQLAQARQAEAARRMGADPRAVRQLTRDPLTGRQIGGGAMQAAQGSDRVMRQYNQMFSMGERGARQWGQFNQTLAWTAKTGLPMLGDAWDRFFPVAESGMDRFFRYTRGGGRAEIQTLIRDLERVARAGTGAAGGAGRLGMGVLGGLSPLTTRALTSGGGMLNRAADWAQSARGRQRIGEVAGTARPMGVAAGHLAGAAGQGFIDLMGGNSGRAATYLMETLAERTLPAFVDFIDKAAVNTPQFVEILGNLAETLMTLFGPNSAFFMGITLLNNFATAMNDVVQASGNLAPALMTMGSALVLMRAMSALGARGKGMGAMVGGAAGAALGGIPGLAVGAGLGTLGAFGSRAAAVGPQASIGGAATTGGGGLKGFLGRFGGNMLKGGPLKVGARLAGRAFLPAAIGLTAWDAITAMQGGGGAEGSMVTDPALMSDADARRAMRTGAGGYRNVFKTRPALGRGGTPMPTASTERVPVRTYFGPRDTMKPEEWKEVTGYHKSITREYQQQNLQLVPLMRMYDRMEGITKNREASEGRISRAQRRQRDLQREMVQLAPGLERIDPVTGRSRGINVSRARAAISGLPEGAGRGAVRNRARELQARLGTALSSERALFRDLQRMGIGLGTRTQLGNAIRSGNVQQQYGLQAIIEQRAADMGLGDAGKRAMDRFNQSLGQSKGSVQDIRTEMELLRPELRRTKQSFSDIERDARRTARRRARAPGTPDRISDPQGRGRARRGSPSDDTGVTTRASRRERATTSQEAGEDHVEQFARGVRKNKEKGRAAGRALGLETTDGMHERRVTRKAQDAAIDVGHAAAGRRGWDSPGLARQAKARGGDFTKNYARGLQSEANKARSAAQKVASEALKGLSAGSGDFGGFGGNSPGGGNTTPASTSGGPSLAATTRRGNRRGPARVTARGGGSVGNAISGAGGSSTNRIAYSLGSSAGGSYMDGVMEAASAAAASMQTMGGGGPVLGPGSGGMAAAQRLAQSLQLSATEGPGTTSGHTGGSLHYSGKAWDVSGSGGQMRKFFLQAAQQFGSSINELFYDPMGYYYDEGKRVEGAIGGHSDHVHIGFFAGGGRVPGRITGKDSVPAMLSPNEFVVTGNGQELLRRWTGDKNVMNRLEAVQKPHFAGGGPVSGGRATPVDVRGGRGVRPITITGNTFNVRKDSDIKKIARELTRQIQGSAINTPNLEGVG